MKPVRTRSPGRVLLFLVAAWAAWFALPFALFRVRPDLPFLPPAWFVATAISWLAGSLVPLSLALLPRRRQVLPDGERALVAALAATSCLVAISAVFMRGAPGHSISLPLLMGVRNCTTLATVFALVPIVLGFAALRRLVPVGSWRVGAGLGAAAGALGGLLLHCLCPVADALHVSVAHGGAVVICALLGAAFLPLFRAR
jgi:hypothetical protein